MGSLSIPELELFNSLLGDAIAGDLDAEVFGVGWWRTPTAQLDARRRVLVSDYLLAAVRSIGTNVIDARFHQLEARELADRVDARIAAAGGRLVTEGMGPAFDSIDAIVDEHGFVAHVVGALRATASTLDCLATVVVGVAGVPTKIVTTGWSDALRGLAKQKASDHPHARLHGAITKRVGEVGPVGWLDWCLGYRNMLVHRARRTEYGVVRRRVVVRGGQPVATMGVVHHLASAPRRSDVESWATFADAWPVLSEDAQVTLRGVLRSTIDLVESLADGLLELWKARRAAPDCLVQPLEQWPDPPDLGAAAFAGYDEHKTDPGADVIRGSPEMVTRMVCAGVASDQIAFWRDPPDPSR